MKDQNHEITQYVERLATDFEFFAEQLWEQIELPDLARHQRQMARWLQNGPRRRGILAFRGASKTWVTLAYTCWLLFRDPDTRILLVSKSEKHSKDSLFMVRRWIGTVPFLQHLAPDVKAGQRDSATKFDVGPAKDDRTPSFTAAGSGGMITGMRSHAIIADDCESNINTLTREQRDKLRELVKEFDNILIPGGDIVFLGTPHHQESLYDKLMDSGYDFKAWPARYPGGDWPDLPHLADELREDLTAGTAQPGDSTWPTRFDDQELLEREASEGRSTFGMQYQMLTSVGDGLQYPLKLQDFMVMPVNRDRAPMTVAWGRTNDRGGSTRLEDIPSLGFGSDGWYAPIRYDEDWANYATTKMWIDPSGSGADSTSYSIISYLGGYLWCHACQGLPGGYSLETLSELARAAREFRVREIVCEANFGQAMFTSLMEPVLQRHFIPQGTEGCEEGWACTIDSQRVSGQKELRIIQAIEVATGSRRVILDPRVAANQELQKQIVSITRDRNCLKHDDEVEALAMGIKLYEEYLAVDPNRAAARMKEQNMEDQLREHYAAMGLTSSEGPSWIVRR